MALERDFLTEQKIYCDAGTGCGRCLSEVDPDVVGGGENLVISSGSDNGVNLNAIGLEREGSGMGKKIGCPSPAAVSKLKLCKHVRAGNFCVGENEKGESPCDKCGTRKMGNCPDKKGKARDVYHSVVADRQLHQASIDKDARGILSMVSKAKRNEIHKTCNWALYDDHYCMYLKHEMGIPSMTCTQPLGGVERTKFKAECTSDSMCRDVKSTLHTACVEFKCRMRYKRIVKVGMVTSDDRNQDLCSKLGVGWETVKVDTSGWDDPEEQNQIRGGTSTGQSRMCVKYSEEPVTENPETHGVCRMIISKDMDCGSFEEGRVMGGATKHTFRRLEFGLGANGDLGQYDHDPALWICVAYDGCEGRGSDDIEKPLPALTAIGLIRDGGKMGGRQCPSDFKDAQRIYTNNGANGDWNQGMNSGGDVFMCETRETDVMVTS